MAVSTHGAWNVSQRLCDAAIMRGQQAASDERGPSQLQRSPHSAAQHTAVTLRGHPSWRPLNYRASQAVTRLSALPYDERDSSEFGVSGAAVGQRTRCRPPQSRGDERCHDMATVVALLQAAAQLASSEAAEADAA
jgi:hypothetical protein